MLPGHDDALPRSQNTMQCKRDLTFEVMMDMRRFFPRLLRPRQRQARTADSRLTDSPPLTEATAAGRPTSAKPPALFDQLVVSNPKKRPLKRSLSASMMSLALHGGLLGGAVMATARASEVGVERHADTTTMVFLTPQAEPEPRLPTPAKPNLAQVIRLDPPPKGFQTLEAPVDIPSDIPAIDLTEKFDPRNFSGKGVEGGVFNGVEGGTGPVDLTRTYRMAAVDERPERLSGPPLYYPRILREAGLEGVVLIAFVIDTSGRVEQSSINVIEAREAGFVRSAVEVISKSLYRPGRVRGVPVRVMVEQQVEFSLLRWGGK